MNCVESLLSGPYATAVFRLCYRPSFALVVFDTSKSMLLVERTTAALESQLAWAGYTAVEDFTSTKDSNDSSIQDCMLRNMDYSLVEKLH